MNNYSFNISLSILNHLGRNLYRSFITVLGEAVSNSWDADAENVFITIDRENSLLVIQDDGNGMSNDDFQNKFLKIGYSKRKDDCFQTASGRPFIGRKGIGKLALLSCAKTITILTKTENSEIVGGVIDNSELDEAIKDDVTCNEYNLGIPSEELFDKYSKDLEEKGTIIIFKEIKDEIRSRISYLKKLIALYFRFALKDQTFKIYLNGDLLSINELDDIKEHTQFVWKLNDIKDPYLDGTNFKKECKILIKNKNICGFIASVEKPSNLKINGTDEKISIDLYVNGRLREKDILRHIPTTRIVENYLYGQIHYDDLDDDNDRFTSSREGVVPDDPKFNGLLKALEEVLKTVIDNWDEWRSEINQDGDPENARITRKERKAQELFNVVTEDFMPSKDNDGSRKKVENWICELKDDATFNFASYSECFISENLLRKYIEDKQIPIPQNCQNTIDDLKNKTIQNKQKANINFQIRQDDTNLSYLDMGNLAYVADRSQDKNKEASLQRDSDVYKPIRDALAHTARLTKIAKQSLNTTYENIKFRVLHLLNKA